MDERTKTFFDELLAEDDKRQMVAAARVAAHASAEAMGGMLQTREQQIRGIALRAAAQVCSGERGGSPFVLEYAEDYAAWITTGGRR